jgi:hypothetical protein
MDTIGVTVGLVALVLVLAGALMILQKKRTYYIPEGFTTEYPTDAGGEILNPITKILKKVGTLSLYFANPTVWFDVYKTSKMTPAELARMNIEKEKRESKASP